MIICDPWRKRYHTFTQQDLLQFKDWINNPTQQKNYDKLVSVVENWESDVRKFDVMAPNMK